MCNVKKVMAVLYWIQVTSCDKIHDTDFTEEKTYQQLVIL